jgi:NADPH-dependent 2,4-dienoyl-CoA reductase/sulfur reductase-like enzyme
MFGSASRWGIEAKTDSGVRFMDRTGDMPIRGVQIPRVVIVGGGFGGLYAAKGLSNEAVAVTLIDRKNHHTFQPLLYQVALGVLSQIPRARGHVTPHETGPGRPAHRD